MLSSLIAKTRALDLGNIGANFTCCNNKAKIERIYQILDKIIASPNWVSSFPKAVVLNMPKVYL